MKKVSDEKWVDNICDAIKLVFNDTALETYYRSGHSLSKYLKFKDKKFNHQIRISNHPSIRWSTKFQCLRNVKNSEVIYVDSGNEYLGYTIWILQSNDYLELCSSIVNFYEEKELLSVEEVKHIRDKIEEVKENER